VVINRFDVRIRRGDANGMRRVV